MTETVDLVELGHALDCAFWSVPSHDECDCGAADEYASRKDEQNEEGR